MLKITDIQYGFYKNGIEAVSLFNKLSLDLVPGQMNFILGSNGSGKSTLLNIISGRIKASSGQIVLNNLDQKNCSFLQWTKMVSMVPQRPGSASAAELSVLQNFRLAAIKGAYPKLKIGNSKPFRTQIFNRLKSLNMGLENRLDEAFGNFSGGQQQVMTVQMAVLGNPGVLLMDEPTAALDVKTAPLVMQMVKELTQKHQLITIIVSHNPSEILRFADYLHVLKNGQFQKSINAEGLLSLAVSDITSYLYD